MPQPTVSVIVPLYNNRPYIAEALDSALAQSVREVEVIVVDDGSTDGGGEVVRRYETVRLITQPNSGQSVARNRAIEAATGSTFAFLDADDRWEPDKLALQLAAFDADPAADIVFGMVREFHSPELPGAAEKALRFGGEAVPGYIPSAMIVRREAFFRVGLFDTGLLHAGYVAWYARAQALGLRVVLVPRLVAWRRLHLTNSGLRSPAYKAEYVRILKASIDNRRAAASHPEP
jgi:glycosyltransferase involved in cell wall biosynthesis